MGGQAKTIPCYLLRIGLIIVVAIFLGVFLLWFVAYLNNYHQESNLVEFLRNSPDALDRVAGIEGYRENAASVDQLKLTLNDLDEQIKVKIKDEDALGIESLSKIKQQVVQELQIAESKYAVMAYDRIDPVTFLFPVFYVFYGVLVFLMPDVYFYGVTRPTIKYSQILRFSAFLFVAYRLPHWARAANFFPEIRRVFAWPNWDISPSGFLAQELDVVFIVLLICSAWSLHISYFESIKKRVEMAKNGSTGLVVKRLSDFVSNAFLTWLVTSFLVSLPFLVYTIWFWHVVIAIGDARYIPSGVSIQFMWGITWGLASLPLLYVWHQWWLARSDLIAKLVENTGTTENIEAKVHLIKEWKPIPVWGALSALIASLGSFLYPILSKLAN